MNTPRGPWLEGKHAPEPMNVLLPCALRALEAEEKALALAVAQRGPQGRPSTEGLLEHLYENALTYIVFRAWLPVADVEWECQYEAGKCDLVVHLDPAERVLIEIKWWNTMTKKTTDGLKKDIARLRDARAGGRYLLCFWTNSGDEVWKEDREAVIASGSDLNAVPVYLEKFAARVEDGEDVVTGYFGMAAFRVDA